MKVKIQKLDSPTTNGRIYTADSFKGLPDVVYGYAEMPRLEEMGLVDLSKVTHAVKNLRIEDGYLVGDVHILQTPVTKMLEEMGISNGLESNYGLAGTGKVDKTGKVTEFTVHSVSLVTKPD